jgi:hypothetical protein
MRLHSNTFLRRGALAALPLALSALLAGCGATAPTATDASKTVAWRSVGLAPASQPASPWASLQAQVGRAPAEGSDILRSGRLADRLGELLGQDNYLVLLQNMRTATPLRQEGSVLYITGHRHEQGDGEAAAVVVHPAADAVRVWLFTDGEEWEVQDIGAPKTWPAAVVRAMENARR